MKPKIFTFFVSDYLKKNFVGNKIDLKAQLLIAFKIKEFKISKLFLIFSIALG